MKISKPIVLTGMMGSGKSSTGKALAARLQLPFIDLDAEIEREQAAAISAIFEKQGEAGFRALEKQKLASLMNTPAVIATGGGAVLDEGNRRLLKEQAIAVWLKADIDVLSRRVAADGSRPLLKGEDPKSVLRRLLEQRESLYAQAPLTVLNNGNSVEQAVEEILRALQNYTRS